MRSTTLAQPLHAELEVALFRNGSQRIATGNVSVEIAARGTLEVDSSTLFDNFMDLSYAYRFGPSQYDVAVARLTDAAGSKLIAQACHFPRGLSAERVEDLGLAASVQAVQDDEWRLNLRSERFAHAIALDLPEFTVEDCYFNLSPGEQRSLTLHATVAGAKPRGFARPLNAQSATRITVAKAPE